MFFWTSDTVGSVLSSLDLVNDYFSIDSSVVSWVSVRDVSGHGEVTFGDINSALAEYFFSLQKDEQNHFLKIVQWFS